MERLLVRTIVPKGVWIVKLHQILSHNNKKLESYSSMRTIRKMICFHHKYQVTVGILCNPAILVSTITLKETVITLHLFTLTLNKLLRNWLKQGDHNSLIFFISNNRVEGGFEPFYFNYLHGFPYTLYMGVFCNSFWFHQRKKKNISPH